MKRKIRYNAFETNSSSVHAICISKKSRIISLSQSSYKIYYKYPLIFKPGNYNREFEILKAPEEKASYFYTALLCLYEREEDKLKIALDKLGNILSYYDIKYKFIAPGENERYFVGAFGALDHFAEDILNDRSKLLTFLFGDSFIVTGNDEEPEYDAYMHKNPVEANDFGGYWNYSGEFKEEFDGYEIIETAN